MDAMIRAAISLSVLAVLVLPSSAAPLSPEELQQKVETVREDAGLVALGAVIANADGDILGLAVDGARVQGGS